MTFSFVCDFGASLDPPHPPASQARLKVFVIILVVLAVYPQVGWFQCPVMPLETSVYLKKFWSLG